MTLVAEFLSTSYAKGTFLYSYTPYSGITANALIPKEVMYLQLEIPLDVKSTFNMHENFWLVVFGIKGPSGQ